MPKHFNYGNIFHYLVENVTSVDFSIACSDNDDNDEDQTGQSSENLHTSKSFTKGRNLFRSGHVKNMEDSQQKEHYFLKATVQASYSQKSYSVTVTISEHSGTIKEASCTCSAAGLGRCAHVAALIFAILDMNYQLAQRNCVAGTKGGRKLKHHQLYTPKSIHL